MESEVALPRSSSNDYFFDVAIGALTEDHIEAVFVIHKSTATGFVFFVCAKSDVAKVAYRSAIHLSSLPPTSSVRGLAKHPDINIRGREDIF